MRQRRILSPVAQIQDRSAIGNDRNDRAPTQANLDAPLQENYLVCRLVVVAQLG